MLTHQLMLGSRQFSRIFDISEGDLLTENSELLVQEDGDKLLLEVFVATYYELGDHEGTQTIDTTWKVNTGSTLGLLVTALGYRTWVNRTTGFLWSGDGTHLYVPFRHDSLSQYAILDFQYATPYDLTSALTGPTVEMIITDASFSAGNVIEGIQWDMNGDIIIVTVDRTIEPFEYTGFDVSTPYYISGEGTKTSADRDVTFAGFDNGGVDFSIDDTAFLHVAYNLGDILQYDVDNNGMPQTTAQDNVAFPDVPVGMGNTTGGVMFYNSGLNLITWGSTGGSGIYYGIRRYELSGAYDLSTLSSSLEHINFDASATNYLKSKGAPKHFRWNANGSKYYWMGGNGSGGTWMSQVTV